MADARAAGRVAPVSALLFASLLSTMPFFAPRASGAVPEWLRREREFEGTDDSPGRSSLRRTAERLRLIASLETREPGSGAEEAEALARQFLESKARFDEVSPGEAPRWDRDARLEVARGIWVEFAGTAGRWCRITPGPRGARVLRVEVRFPGGLRQILRDEKSLGDLAAFRKRVRGLPNPLLKPLLRTHRFLTKPPQLEPHVECERGVLSPDRHAALTLVLERLAAPRRRTTGLRNVEERPDGSAWADVIVVADGVSTNGTASPVSWTRSLTSDAAYAWAVNRLVDAAIQDLPFRPCRPSKEEREWIRTRVLGPAEPAGLEPARALLAETLEIDRD